MSKEITMKPGISRASRAVLALLAAGFTLISAYNGFNFYKVLFGLSMSILITATFEVARLSCLFSFMRKGKKIGALGVATYIVVASVCAFAAINSFTYEVILRDRAGCDQYRDQIHKIKQEYSRNVAEMITNVAKDITYAERMAAKYNKSGYWKRRLSQIVAKRDRLVAQRNAFLKDEPENPEQWIKANSALLGMELEGKSSNSEEMISVTKALKELWGLNKSTAQKLMGIVVTATVELSILLLSFLAGVADKQQEVAKKSKEITDVAEVASVAAGKEKPRNVAEGSNEMKEMTTKKKETATPNIDEESLEEFVVAHKEYFQRTGKLPPLRILSRKQREVRKVLEAFSHDDLKKLFGK